MRLKEDAATEDHIMSTDDEEKVKKRRKAKKETVKKEKEAEDATDALVDALEKGAKSSDNAEDDEEIAVKQ